MRRVIAVAVATSIWLTLCDQLFHVRTHTLVYHWTPQVADQHVLVPLTFLIAGALMVVTAQMIGPPVDGDVPWVRLFVGFAIVTVAYLVSGLLPTSLAGTYAVVLLVAWAARARARGGRVPTVVTGILIAGGGVVAESILSSAGQFDYLHPDVAGVPWWLFPLYLHGSLLAIDVAHRISAYPTRAEPTSLDA